MMFRNLKDRMVLFAADGDGGGDADAEAEKNFEAFVLTLPEEHRPAARTQHDNLLKAIKAERAEKKQNAKRTKELEDAEAERQKKALSAEELLKKEKQDAETRAAKAEGDLLQERLRTRFIAEAGKAEYGEGDKKQRFIDPEAAYDLAVARHFEMKFENGKTVGITEALKELSKNAWMLEAGETKRKQPGPSEGKQPASESEEQKREEILNRKRAEYSPL